MYFQEEIKYMYDLQQLFGRREFIRKLAKDLGVRKDIADAAFFDEVVSSTKDMVIENKKEDTVEPPKQRKRSEVVSRQIGKMSKFISNKNKN